MHYKLIVFTSVLAMGIFALLSERLFSRSKEGAGGSVYDFTVTGIDGAPVDFERFRGRNILIVNTASKCGYTPQYETLEKLHQTYGERVVVLGFPANNFLWQEPGTNDEIAGFCRKNYGVTFQLFQKVSVKGKDAHPLYRWLAARSGKKPTWNFCKYLINKKGEVSGFFGPKVSPMDESILQAITNQTDN